MRLVGYDRETTALLIYSGEVRRARRAFCAVQLAVFILSTALLTGSAVPQGGALKSIPLEVSFFTFNCDKFSGSLKYTIDAVTVGAKAQRLQGDLYQLRVGVSPGTHELLLDASSKGNASGCVTNRTFDVLPGRSRHLVMALGVTLTRRSRCSVAGALPIHGMSAALVLPKGSLVPNTISGGYLMVEPSKNDLYYPLEVDGDAYYAEHISPVKYVVRLFFGGWSGDIPLDLTGAANIREPECVGSFIHNITVNDVKKAFPLTDIAE